MRLKPFLLLLFLPMVFRSAAGQNIVSISNREGLSNSSILSLAQDTYGYIWAGSCEGLNRWDGKHVRQFKLSGNLIYEILPTDDGVLWIRSNYGFDRLDLRTNGCERHGHFNRLYAATARSRDEAFLIHEGVLYGYNPRKAAFETVDLSDSDAVLDRRTRIFLDGSGTLWIVCSDGLRHFRTMRLADGSCSVQEAGFIPFHSGLFFSRMLGDEICFAGRDGILYRFDTRSRRMTPVFELRQVPELRSDALVTVERDGGDYLVAFARSGLWRIRAADAEGGGRDISRMDVKGSIFSLLKDRYQDIVWIGTDGNGLLRQYNEDVRIRSVGYGELPYALSKPIKALHVDDAGDLWIGTKRDGMLRIRNFYACGKYTRENTSSYTTANSALRHDAIYAFAPSRRNLLWIGGDGGVSYYSYALGRIVPLTEKGTMRRVHALYEDSDGVLWAATVGDGVYRIRLAGNGASPRIDEIRPLDLGERARRMNFFFSITETPDGSLWFCNHGVGAFRYDRAGGRAEEIVFDTRRGLPVNEVTAMARCSDSTLWFGTGYGVVCYDAAAGAERPTPAYGNELLRTGVIHGIVADSLDNLWVGTNAGIVRYTPSTNRSVAYDASYGLEVVEFSDGACFYDRRAGCLFFGGNDGFIVVSGARQAAPPEPYMPPILFNGITIGGVEYGLDALMRRGRLTLGHRQASFALSLIALDYINGGNYSYLYNIGPDPDAWQDNSYDARLIFANLRPGDYTLRVRYRNNATGELSEVRSLGIRIRPPAYAAWWAVVLYVVLGAAGMFLCVRYLLVRRRIRERRKRELYERKYREILYESRINTFANLAADLSLPLTLINGPCEQILSHRNTDAFVRQWAGLIRSNAQKIGDMVYLVHELASDLADSGGEQAEWTDVSRLAGNISQTFLDRAEAAGIAYRVSVAPNLLFPSVPRLLTTIVNLMLSNAFDRSASAGDAAVRLTVGLEEERLRLVVTNRGGKLDPNLAFMISDLYRFLDYLGSDLRDRPVKNDMELAICHNLASKLQGSFDIAGEADGTSLVVLLPRLPIQQVMPEHAAGIPEPGVHGAPEDADELLRLDALLPTMLFICEDRDMNMFVPSLFRDEYDVLICPDTASLDEVSPRIVLCSMAMLNDRLLGVLRDIRRSERLRLVPIVLLTAAPHPELRIMETGLDIDLCLPLPFSNDHLRNAVNRLVRRYDSLRDSENSVFGSFDLVQGRMLRREDKAFLNRMLEIIQRNILDPELSTQAVASQMGVSMATFYNRIGTITGRTPVTIIKEFRLGYAQRLLARTKLSIDEIIYKSGFSNRSTFFRNFSARFGCTPKAYRERKLAELQHSPEKSGEGNKEQ